MVGLDWMVVGAYFALVFGVAFWSGYREQAQENTEAFFLAGKNVGWFIIGASLFASNIGSEHLVGLAGAGAAGGVAVAQFEILAGLILLLLGWVFVPFYLKSGVFTMPEFLERRYSSGPRLYLAIISIVGYVLTKISVTIAAGGIVFETLMGIDFWTGALIVVVATGIYTVWGGLRAVLYTDTVQMFVLIGGAIAVTVIGLQEVGGWRELQVQAGDDYFDLWKPLSDPEFPWTGILFGAPILGVWYWCTDQFIVQRVLSARDEDNARRGTVFAAFLKQLPLFIFVVPGIIAYVLSKSGQLQMEQADQALPALIGALLPDGLRGLVVAGLLAALMSSLSSVFNSCSTLITFDLYKRLRPQVGERHLVVVGQISTLLLVGCGLLWIPFMELISGRLFTYLQSVQAYISPPIAAVFLIGIMWRGANARGAIAALAVGFVLGIGRLVLEMNKASLDGVWLMLASINFLHFAIIIFIASVIALVAASLTAAAPSAEQLQNLTFSAVPQRLTGTELDGVWRKRDKLLSIALLVLIAWLWWYFSY
ncbi:sodium/solute symporter [Exilibacterium tricleocarpae]|uniref:Sodium/solute symporter n=1 Tax=Exilibacterium tricleocarpae TaxID=2591008 RepID=A0A545U789_9GAMM|nr:sodium/solute symporter [Exilibacterium tricleocarpae]